MRHMSLLSGTIRVGMICLLTVGVGLSAAASEAKDSAVPESAAAAEGAPADAGVDYVEMVKTKAAAIKSVRAVQTMAMSMMGQEMEMGGKIAFAAPEMFRMELEMEGMPAASNVTISDGKTTWMTMPQAGMTRKIDLVQAREALGGDFAMPGGGMGGGQSDMNFSDPFSGVKDGTVKYVATDEIDGVECLAFEAEPKVPGEVQKSMEKFLPKSMKLWVEKETGVLRRQILLTGSGSKMMQIDITDVELNPELDPGLFQYTPKEDEQVIDMTEMMIKMMQGMVGRGAKTVPEAPELPEESAPESEGSDEKPVEEEALDRGI